MANPVFTQPFEVDDFSGGMTDNFIAGRKDQFEAADNMILKKYGRKGKPFTINGSVIYNSDYYRIPSNTRLSGLIDNEGALFQFSGKNVYTIDGGWETIQGPTGNSVFDQGTAADNYACWARWNKHLLVSNDAYSYPQKIYNDGVGWVSRTLGLPQIDSSGITITPSVGANTYLYKFIHADSYSIGTVTFREVSQTSVVRTVSSADAPNTNQIAISDIPTLANSTTGNYNTAALTIEIYRTTNGGTTFYKVGEVTNGTTTFNDNVSDATLQTNQALYTEGGVVDFEQAPQCKFILVAGDVAFYLGVKEGSETLGNRVRQSVPGSLYASPSNFFSDLESDIVGGAVKNGYPIVFCKNKKIYRLEGRFDRLGQGGLFAREVKDPVECVSHRSIVTTPDGVWFASKDNGFCVTDGFSVTQPEGSKDIPDSYAEIVASDTQKARIYGSYDSKERRIWWAAQRDSTSNDNDIVYVAHLDAPNVPFTTLSGGDDIDNFAPSSLLYLDGYMLQGDRRGYLFKHGGSALTRPKIDTSTAPSNWATQTIIYDFRSCAFDFGTGDVRKWTPRVIVNADNTTNLSLQVSTAVDNTGIFENLAEIKYQGNAPWDDEDGPTWGSDQIRWRYAPTINHIRKVPSPIRCSYRQLRMTNAHTEIESYEDLGTASSNGTTKVITLDDNTKEWSGNAVGYYISFSDDAYVREFEITARNSDTQITVEDTQNYLTTTSTRQWKIRGKKKSQLFNLISYIIDVAPISQSQNTPRTQEA
jgi:hypothetical protein